MSYYKRENDLLWVPPLWNSSCLNSRLWHDLPGPAWGDYLKAFLWLILAIVTVFLNGVWLAVLNNRKYCRKDFISEQPKVILSALALNGILFGLCCPLPSIFTNVFNCWPFGKRICQFQAIADGILSQTFVVLMVLMSMERLLRFKRPKLYEKNFSMKMITVFLAMCAIISMVFYIYLVFIAGAFSYNPDSSGAKGCQVFWGSVYTRIFTSCLFYFTPTLSLMYCYGSFFHAKESRTDESCSSQTRGNPALPPETLAQTEQHLDREYNLARSTAAMSLTFVVVTTPWTVRTVVTLSTGATPPHFVDFLGTLLGHSYNFWLPLLFVVFSGTFREAAISFVQTEILCQRAALKPCCSSDFHALGVLEDRMQEVTGKPR